MFFTILKSSPGHVLLLLVLGAISCSPLARLRGLASPTPEVAGAPTAAPTPLPTGASPAPLSSTAPARFGLVTLGTTFDCAILQQAGAQAT
jgi:hypothetical protein